ncbi:NUDIX domain-containing protein [Nitrosomonas sp.]|uniref:NUDIX domain-containing protein n=1 Tax=Nitrosomonas sp. TaxID=42353 RepID=UPI0037C89878
METDTMTGFSDSYLGKLRAVVGARLLLMPGARVIIENAKGEILLQRRSDFDVWGLPGGNAEEGEDLESVVRREVAEEVGLVVDDLHPYGFASDPQHETITFPNGHQCQYFVLMFHTRTYSGQARVSDDESTDVGWFRPDDLPTMLPNMARSVDAYLRYVATGDFQSI